VRAATTAATLISLVKGGQQVFQHDLQLLCGQPTSQDRHDVDARLLLSFGRKAHDEPALDHSPPAPNTVASPHFLAID
jgi:hypothetical protein